MHTSEYQFFCLFENLKISYKGLCSYNLSTEPNLCQRIWRRIIFSMLNECFLSFAYEQVNISMSVGEDNAPKVWAARHSRKFQILASSDEAMTGNGHLYEDDVLWNPLQKKDFKKQKIPIIQLLILRNIFWRAC